MNPYNKKCACCAKPSRLCAIALWLTIALWPTACTPPPRLPVGTDVIMCDGDTLAIILPP